LWRTARCRRRSLVVSDSFRTTMLAMRGPFAVVGDRIDITAIASVRQAR
jgi:hypothetical protein